mgnify:CR=1 FL=1
MKRLIFLGVVAFVCSGATLAAATPEVAAGAQKRYVVLYEKSASPAAAQAAITRCRRASPASELAGRRRNRRLGQPGLPRDCDLLGRDRGRCAEQSDRNGSCVVSRSSPSS